MHVWPARTLAAACAGAWLWLGSPEVASAESNPFCAELEPGPTRTVTRVIDGETLALDDGSELRLIGVLAPRAFDVGAVPGTWRPEQEAVEALRSLVLGRTVEIRFAGERTDRYGRLKGHAILTSGGETVWVQARLLEAGLARSHAQAVHRACEAELLAAERPAREARLGVWAEAAYDVRSADDPAALLRHVATFQVVEGRVTRVATTRGAVYLNFGDSRRHGFSVSLMIGDRARLGSFQASPKGLEQALVRVRGCIEERRGAPRIDLSSAGSIEVIEQGQAVDQPGRRPRAK